MPGMNTGIDELIHRVRSFVISSGMTANQLAAKAKISWATASLVFQDDWEPSVPTLRQIEAVVPLDFVAPEFKEQRPKKRKWRRSTGPSTEERAA